MEEVTNHYRRNEPPRWGDFSLDLKEEGHVEERGAMLELQRTSKDAR